MKYTLDAKRVCEMVDNMFKNQAPMLGLWQTLADNFYPERTDFRYRATLGHELADATVDSYPILARRDLGNSFHAMLRDGKWFEITAGNDSEPDRDSKMWLEWATQRQFKVMNDRAAGFTRAVKQGDHDFATFGNTVISIEPNRTYNGIVFRNWHLRDCAWTEDETGQVCSVARHWDPQLFELVRMFGENALPPSLQQKFKKNPYATTRVDHLVVPGDLSQNDKWSGKFKYVSYFVLREGQTMLQETGINYKYYVVPRFQTIAGSPYAYSPATVAALPDSRTLQAMTYTLLEAAERYARPPMVATQNVVQGVLDLRPNGITWVDNEYDERLGVALRPLTQDRGGFPIGASERGRIYEVLTKAFYLDSLSLPMTGQEMTAYEVRERMNEFRRTNLPLFAPLEEDYNGQVCEATFDLLMMMGGLGNPGDIPQGLQGAEVEFKYKSPLTSDEQEEKVNRFQQTSMLLAEAARLDQGVLDNLDFDTAFRDAIEGMNAPVKWLRGEDEIAQVRQARLAQQTAQMEAQAAAQSGGAA